MSATATACGCTSGPRTGDSNPHGHCWEFASWVVAGGGLRETMFTECVAERGTPYDRCEYSRGADGTGNLRPAGRVALREVGDEVRGAGTVYSCPRDVVHTVAPVGSELIATVVVQGPPTSGSTVVYLPTGAPAQHHQDALRAAELRELLGDVADKLR